MSDKEIITAIQSYSQQMGLEAFSIIQGGSRAKKNNTLATIASDGDVVVLVKQPSRRFSMGHAQLPNIAYPLDLIFRTVDNMGYEFIEAQERGSGCVTRIVAEGDILLDNSKKQGAECQKHALEITQQGPKQQDNRAEKTTLLEEINLLHKADFGVQSIGMMEIVQKTTSLLLQANRKFLSKGKIAARELLQHDPDSLKFWGWHR